ncbi:MAG: 50S ribosomal protein L3 [Candidatus Aenigmarchaeota archaeon]|nr:50S ribosomal protein L3 [Candidatus Aenigmarchaeota archaeon]
MAKGHKPKAGSRAYWPKKRAKRIYPRLRVAGSISIKSSEEARPIVFAGYKAGMTHISYNDNRKDSATSGQEISKGVTIVDCPPLVVFGIKLYRKALGKYSDIGTILAENLKQDLSRKLSLPKKKHEKREYGDFTDVRLLVHTQPRESGVSKKKPEVFELDVSGKDPKQKFGYAKERLGKILDITEVFEEGEYVDVKAVDKGKGYQGPVKRFGIVIRSRKNKGKRRHVGTMGPVTPGRVLPGKIPQAGQLGFQTRTEYNKRIVKIGNEGFSAKGGIVNYGVVPKSYMMVEGSIPGPRKRLIMFRKAIRKGIKEPLEITHISKESQQ